ncbi:MAG: AAA family ATPase [Thermoplasmata archaeon]|nr:AAA family ATPase [Thermoplasmata archaeon]
MATKGISDRTAPALAVPVIGRREIVDRLFRRIERAHELEGEFLLIVGRSGVGKSTMLDAAVRRARELGFEVVHGRALPSDLPEPFSLLRDLLGSIPRSDSEGDEGSNGSTLPIFLAPFDVNGASAEARLTSDPPPADGAELDRLLLALVATPGERTDASRSALYGRITDLFVQRASRKAMLLAIDDLQFADDSSLEFLDELVAQLGSQGLLVVATVVPADEAPPRTAEKVRATLEQHARSSLAVRPLTEPEVREYVRWLQRGRDADPNDVMRWFTQTEGNPQFISHLVRASLGLATAAAFSGEQGFEEFVRGQVQALPEGDRRLLIYGSVLGKEFDFAILAKATGGEEERLSESLDRLVRLGLLREHGGEVYEFASERVRADVYSELTDTRRRILHRRVATALEERGANAPGEVFALARHYYLGQADAQSVEYNHRAADLAARAFAYDTAIVFLERALEGARRLEPRDAPHELRMGIELGRYLNEVGDLRRSETLLEETVRDLGAATDRPVDVALAMLGLAQTKSDLTNYTEARALAAEAFAILERLGHKRGLMAAHRILGVAIWRQGDLAGAESHHRAELALAREVGTPLELGHALVDLANTTTTPNARGEAMELYDEADRVFAKEQDYSAHARVLMNRALLRYAAGELEAALRDITQAVEAAEKSRSRIWLGYCLLNLAQIRSDARDYLGAKQAIDRAHALLDPLGDRLATQQTTMIRGMIAEGEHQFVHAEGLFREALEQARSFGLEPQEVEMQLRLALLAERRGDAPAARSILDDERRKRIAALRPDLAPTLEGLWGRVASAHGPSG